MHDSHAHSDANPPQARPSKAASRASQTPKPTGRTPSARWVALHSWTTRAAASHGKYASSGGACLCTNPSIRPFTFAWRNEHRMLIRMRTCASYLDVPRLVAWLSSRQYAPEGGFSGRTNKLVDGCYSHWVGGCFPLIEACLNGSSGGDVAADDAAEAAATAANTTSTATSSSGHRLPPAEDSLFSREGLIRYILCCCQDQTKRGGLRDKPGK